MWDSLFHFRPEFFNYDDLLENDNDANLEHAFRVAHEKLGVEKLLDPEGMNLVLGTTELP